MRAYDIPLLTSLIRNGFVHVYGTHECTIRNGFAMLFVDGPDRRRLGSRSVALHLQPYRARLDSHLSTVRFLCILDNRSRICYEIT